MKFEEAILYLKDGKEIFREFSPEYSLKFNFNDQEIEKTFCIEIWDLIADDWKDMK